MQESSQATSSLYIIKPRGARGTMEFAELGLMLGKQWFCGSKALKQNHLSRIGLWLGSFIQELWGATWWEVGVGVPLLPSPRIVRATSWAWATLVMNHLLARGTCAFRPEIFCHLNFFVVEQPFSFEIKVFSFSFFLKFKLETCDRLGALSFLVSSFLKKKCKKS